MDYSLKEKQEQMPRTAEFTKNVINQINNDFNEMEQREIIDSIKTYFSESIDMKIKDCYCRVKELKEKIEFLESLK